LLGKGGSPVAIDALSTGVSREFEEGPVPKVEIYTKMTCGFCVRAKRLLDMKKVKYDEIHVDMGGPRKAEMVERSGGRMTVPQIFIDGRHVGGCDALMALEYDGKLDELLAA
jgi:glutaredoxin 3